MRAVIVQHIQWNSMRYLGLILALFLCVEVSAQMGSTLRPNRGNSINCQESYFVGQYDSISFAYSLQRLSFCYKGPCLRVRRSSDDAEQDIDFVNDYIDTNSIKSFVGSDTGYVVVIYNQNPYVGASLILQEYDINQSLPFISAGGNIVYSRGEVAVYFPIYKSNGEGNSLRSGPAFTSPDDSYSYLVVFEVVDTATGNRNTGITSDLFYNFDVPGSLNDNKFKSDVNSGSPGDNAYYTLPSGGPLSNEYIAFAERNSSTHTLYINNDAGPTTTIVGTPGTLYAGISITSEASSLIGYWKELVGWLGDNSGNRASILSDRNGFYNTY